ncbi:hypothetical protein CUB86_30500 [Pseudomonas syringae pv. actinidiae]|uniref:Uncharacterized protein n=1 Tax=Pseudomonas syringae pv. actinidiae TaxID=103796 RepID=A0AAU8XAG2_PSESF|nr:hypothetical protein CT122_00090 [Pseudomonas syringae pv. actinidiae]PIN57952.1 hypothetical protein CUB86_30500 [Pseudomonas syringae pv. actinidiae]
MIEKDHRQYYGYDEPEVSTRSPARHDPVDDVRACQSSMTSLLGAGVLGTTSGPAAPENLK